MYNDYPNIQQLHYRFETNLFQSFRKKEELISEKEKNNISQIGQL